jgi:hypothetical protein
VAVTTETHFGGAAVEDGVPNKIITGGFGLGEFLGEGRLGSGLATGEG